MVKAGFDHSNLKNLGRRRKNLRETSWPPPGPEIFQLRDAVLSLVDGNAENPSMCGPFVPDLLHRGRRGVRETSRVVRRQRLAGKSPSLRRARALRTSFPSLLRLDGEAQQKGRKGDQHESDVGLQVLGEFLDRRLAPYDAGPFPAHTRVFRSLAHVPSQETTQQTNVSMLCFPPPPGLCSDPTGSLL